MWDTPKNKRAKILRGEAKAKRDEEVAKAYLAGGNHLLLGAQYGIAPKTVQKIASEYRLKDAPADREKRGWRPETRNKWTLHYRLIARLVRKGASIEAIQSRWPLSKARIQQICRIVNQGGRPVSMKAFSHVIEDAARMGFHQRKLPPDYRRVEWTLQCSKCPMVMVAHWEQNMKPEAMARHARTRQWDVGYGMRPICPACLHTKPKGPDAKPNGQSFDRHEPPPTQIFDALLDAANKRSIRAKLPELAADIVQAELEAAYAKQQLHDSKIAQDEQERAAAQHRRVLHARQQRIDRLAQEDAQRRAEQAGASAPETATAHDASPDETASQQENAPQAEKEVMNMPTPAPSPKISHAVFQSLDSIFDPVKRLYRNGYTDQRVAKDCGTTEEIVAYLRGDLYGALAEDPRLTSLRDDFELIRMESAECFARLQKQISEAQSRLEQLAHK